MKYKIGYDLDGVIAKFKPTEFDYFMLKLFPRLYLKKLHKNAKCLMRPKEGIIITGRDEKLAKVTETWLEKNNINLPVIYNKFIGRKSYDLYKWLATKHKAYWINYLKLKIFFESERIQADLLREACPNCRIVWAGSFDEAVYYTSNDNEDIYTSN